MINRNDQTQLRQPLTGTKALGLLAGYFALHSLSRILVSNSLQLDEAYQMLLTQRWSWGYGSQGPLYTWLLCGLFQLFGPGVAGLALLKNALLFGAYAFTYLSGREVLGRESHAAVAAVGLLFIPHLAWESQRDQTHLVLATMLAAATLYATLRTVRTRSLGWCVRLGVVAGAGLLSKYNFAVFLLALGLALLTGRTTRCALVHRGALLAGAVLVASTAPHWAWVWNHPHLLVSESDAFQIGKQTGALPASVQGLINLLVGVLQYGTVPAMFGIFCWRAPAPTEPDLASPTLARLLARTVGWAVAICAAAVGLFGVTSVRARWLQPLLVPLPILCAYAARRRLAPTRQRGLFAAAVAVGVTVLVAVNGTVLGAGWLGRPHNLNVPFDQLAQQLRQAGFDGGTILSDNRRVAGNLRLQFPNAVVMAPNTPRLAPPAGKPVLLVWDATHQMDPPEALMRFATDVLGSIPTSITPQSVQAPGRHGDPRITRLGFIRLPPS